VDQTTRAREIVNGLLAFARQSPLQLARIDVNQVVGDCLRSLERDPRLQDMVVRTEISKVPVLVDADPVQLQQVLVNIVENALDAMRPGGTLTVRTGFAEQPGLGRIAVSDTGTGITDSDLPHIFEPFFTTKEVGRGVGLGLAISHGIVTRHGGRIEVASQVDSGSTFRVLLPLAEGEV
jgi:two-component system NtrC family sensor kinase